MLVNSIVNNMNRKAPGCWMEMTMLIWTFDCHSVLNEIHIIMLCIQFFSAPRTDLDLHRVWFFIDTTLLLLIDACPCIFQMVGGEVATDPQTNGNLISTQIILLAQQFTCKYQDAGSFKLLECQKTKCIPHNYGNTICVCITKSAQKDYKGSNT